MRIDKAVVYRLSSMVVARWKLMAGFVAIAGGIVVACLLLAVLPGAFSTSTSLTEIGAVHLTNFNNRLVFFVTKRYENPRNIWATWNSCALWRSDGTAAGTALLRRGCPAELVGVDGMLFFILPREGPAIELWKNDGTSAGTTLVKAIP